jgi:hypothetical protein
LKDADFLIIEESDDIDASNKNFRLQKAVLPGTYYVRIFGYDVVTTGNYSIRSTFTPSGAAENAKKLGSRGTVSPSKTLYGGFELARDALVYILVRGNSLGTLGVTQAFLDAPRVRLYDAQGHDIVSDQAGPGFNGCTAAPVVSYYQGGPVHARDSCVAQTLPAGGYTFSVTPSSGSAPDTGEVLFEVVLGGGSGGVLKTLASRGTVTPATTLYGAFETMQPMTVYILVRGNSLGALGVTQSFLDGPRVRLFDAQGADLLMEGGIPGFRLCEPGNPRAQAVRTYYELTRGAVADSRDGCVAQTLPPGAYTFSVTPEPGSTSTGEVLFEVTLAP